MAGPGEPRADGAVRAKPKARPQAGRVGVAPRRHCRGTALARSVTEMPRSSPTRGGKIFKRLYIKSEK